MDTNTSYARLNNDTINIHEYYEVEHWSKELHTTVESLRHAVEHVGTSIQDIKNYLDHK